MITRTIYNELIKELNKKEILAVIGPRQVGKTTIIKEILKVTNKKVNQITFDRISDLEKFENNIELFIEEHVLPYDIIFIDEFQYAKLGGKHLKYIYDTHQKKIVISGSSVPELSINSLQYLVGRVRIIELFPLSLIEFISFKDSSKLFLLEKKRKCEDFKQIELLFEEYLIYGGYPAIVVENDKTRKEALLSDIINTYLLKEVREILQYKSIFEYENLLKRLSLQDGSLMNKNSISIDLTIPTKTITEVLLILEKTYMISILHPYLVSKIKEQIKSPKTFLLDLGIKNGLQGIFKPLNMKLDKGLIYENFIFNSLKKLKIKAFFWNYKNRNEMDFVIETTEGLIGIECKSKLSSSQLTPSIVSFIEKVKPEKVIIFNENIDNTQKYNDTEIIFTHYLNFFNIIQK